MGRKNFSNKLNNLLLEAEKKTFKNNDLQINLALNYGSKYEIIDAIKKIKNSKKKNYNRKWRYSSSTYDEWRCNII